MKSLYAFNQNKCALLILILLFLTGSFSNVSAADPFVPAVGGNLPAFAEFQPIAGQVGGFQVTSSVRHNNTFFSGTQAEVNMSFPDAATLGADLLTLQCKEGTGAWTNYLYDNREVTTTGSNFSLTVDRTYTFRLLLTGGTKNGYVSNEQTANYSNVDTYFSMVTLDESMFLTGVMAPWVGRGLQASFIVKKNSDNSVVEGGLTYQWYRVNPVTFERTLIAGADSLTYATKTADVGYQMLVVATGNQTTVGGFYQMLSGWDIVSPNKSFVSNVSTTGFNLNLYYDVEKLDTGDLVLRDKDWAVVPITAVSKSNTAGIFYVTAPLTLDKNPYSMHNKSKFWRICNEMNFGHMIDLMEGVNIDMTANALGEQSSDTELKMLYNASSRQLRYESVSMVQSISMYTLTGALVNQWNVDQFNGQIALGVQTPGVYMLRFKTQNGTVSKKVFVTR